MKNKILIYLVTAMICVVVFSLLPLVLNFKSFWGWLIGFLITAALWEVLTGFWLNKLPKIADHQDEDSQKG